MIPCGLSKSLGRNLNGFQEFQDFSKLSPNISVLHRFLKNLRKAEIIEYTNTNTNTTNTNTITNTYYSTNNTDNDNYVLI
jgi:hypothetical protein